MADAKVFAEADEKDAPTLLGYAVVFRLDDFWCGDEITEFISQNGENDGEGLAIPVTEETSHVFEEECLGSFCL